MERREFKNELRVESWRLKTWCLYPSSRSRFNAHTLPLATWRNQTQFLLSGRPCIEGQGSCTKGMTSTDNMQLGYEIRMATAWRPVCKRMLIRVLLEDGEGSWDSCNVWIISISLFAEGLFNADCRVAQLLDAIKKKLKVPRSGTVIITLYALCSENIYKCIDAIDLCTPEGEVKALYCHVDDNAAKFFTLRELCLTVKVQG